MGRSSSQYCFAFLCFSLSIFARASDIGILHFKPVGVPDEVAEIVTNFLVADLFNIGYSVVAPDAIDRVVGERVESNTITDAVGAGIKMQVKRVIYGSVIELGEKYAVQLSVVDADTRKVLWSDAATAISTDELGLVCTRLVKALAAGKKFEETAEVGQISGQEVIGEKSRRQLFFSGGAKVGINKTLTGYAGASTLIVPIWLALCFETKKLMVEVAFSAGFSSNLLEIGAAGKVSATQAPVINAYYLFSKGDISPFIHGGGGLGMIAVYDSNGVAYSGSSGLALEFNAGGGIMLFRLYDFHALIMAEYVINFSKLSGFESPHQGIRFGIGFTYRGDTERCARVSPIF